MKASPRQQRLLLDLQALDNSLARLKKQRAALPQRAELAAMQGERSAAKDAFMALQRELDTQNADIERLESDIELVRQRIKRDNELSAASSSPKEAQALQAALDSGRTRTVGVGRDVKVLLHYATAALDDTGAVLLRNDIYGYDAAIVAALDAPVR